MDLFHHYYIHPYNLNVIPNLRRGLIHRHGNSGLVCSIILVHIGQLCNTLASCAHNEEVALNFLHSISMSIFTGPFHRLHLTTDLVRTIFVANCILVVSCTSSVCISVNKISHFWASRLFAASASACASGSSWTGHTSEFFGIIPTNIGGTCKTKGRFCWRFCFIRVTRHPRRSTSMVAR